MTFPQPDTVSRKRVITVFLGQRPLISEYANHLFQEADVISSLYDSFVVLLECVWYLTVSIQVLHECPYGGEAFTQCDSLICIFRRESGVVPAFEKIIQEHGVSAHEINEGRL